MQKKEKEISEVRRLQKKRRKGLNGSSLSAKANPSQPNIPFCISSNTDAIIIITGLYTSPVHNESLCDSSNFLDRTWVTQGRLEVVEPTPYPIVGEYTGLIPDTDSLCAKLYSDCNNPEIMFYTIFNCFNRTQVYEGKDYFPGAGI